MIKSAAQVSEKCIWTKMFRQERGTLIPITFIAFLKILTSFVSFFMLLVFSSQLNLLNVVISFQ